MRQIPSSIFMPPPTTPREQTLNQAIKDAYDILAGKIRTGSLVGFTSNSPTGDASVPAGESVVINRKLTIAAGKKVFIGSGARLRIL